MRSLLAEMRQRNVFKIATTYIIAGWVVLELGSLLFDNFGAPGWVIKVFTSIVFLGFPAACVLAWALEITPEGVIQADKTTRNDIAHRRSDWVWGGLVALTLFMAAVNFAYDWNSNVTTQTAPVSPTESPATADATMGTSIAVMPFVDMSAAGDQQYFGDGIAEELLDALTKVPGLKVAARTSSFSLHERKAGIQEIGQSLKVRYVLEGSVRRADNRLRITAQLIDVSSGFHLFSQSYERRLEDIFTIQNDIAKQIVSALLPSLGISNSELIKQQTTSILALDLRRKGRHAFFNAHAGSLPEAISNLEQAVQADPNYSEAWGDLAYANAYLATAHGEPLVSMARALEAASRGLALDPNGTTALLAMAMIEALFYFDYDSAGQYYRLARGTGVDQSFWSYNIAWLYHFPRGHYQKALEHLHKVQIDDPVSPFPPETLPVAYWGLGDVESAIDAAKAGFDIRPITPLIAWQNAFVLAQCNELALAEKMLALAPPLTPEPSTQEIDAWASINRLKGDSQANRDLLATLMGTRSQGAYISPAAIGSIHLELEQYEQALDWFERGVDVRAPATLFSLPTRIRIDPVLRKHPRALALLKRMNLSL